MRRLRASDRNVDRPRKVDRRNFVGFAAIGLNNLRFLASSLRSLGGLAVFSQAGTIGVGISASSSSMAIAANQGSLNRQDNPANDETESTAAEAFLISCLEARDSQARRQISDRALKQLGNLKALEKAPASASFLAAAALGIRARNSRVSETARRGDARAARNLIDRLIVQRPRSSWAWAFSGMWHLEAVRRGGIVATQVYGASVETGLRDIQRARSIGQPIPSLRLALVVTLLSFGGSSKVALAQEITGNGGDQSGSPRVVSDALMRLRAAIASDGAAATNIARSII